MWIIEKARPLLPEASSAFERANRHYALLSDRCEALAKIVGKDGNAPAEQV
jgi:hypothetical protein